MKKEKKLYVVYEKIKFVNDFDNKEVHKILLGYTHATSEKRAISNVKHEKGIKKRNHYVEDIGYGDSMYVHDFIAEEVIL